VTERLPDPNLALFPALKARDVRVLPAGHLIGRIHSQAGQHPTSWDTFRSFGPTHSRFDHQPPPPKVHARRSVLYGVPRWAGPRRMAMPVLRTCVAECFRERGVVELSRDTPYFVLFQLARPLRLLDFSDNDWVSRAGGNAAISSGLRLTSQAWARAIYRHYTGPDAVDGIFYACSTIPAARSVALWERAASAVPKRPVLHRPLADPALRAELEYYADELKLGLVP
jgi:hypothetical protein